MQNSNIYNLSKLSAIYTQELTIYGLFCQAKEAGVAQYTVRYKANKKERLSQKSFCHREFISQSRFCDAERDSAQGRNDVLAYFNF
ncbi:MAG: hypothetical protein BroJett042_18610 [Bacteroidota bacterium]|nr:MAG: hypothetical protein BroJett042_18610 [Bacteroidota bacterium]